MRAPNAKGVVEPRPPDWATVLVDAVKKPGVIAAAYSQFWNYSAGNQLLAMFQCILRRIPAGPIHTYAGWQRLGRRVKRGERAITLCMPLTVSRRRGPADPAESETVAVEASGEGSALQSSRLVTVFAYKPHWFVLAQTEGADYVPVELPAWSEDRALPALAVERVPFEHPNGNAQGFARHRQISVSPIAFLPHKTLFHELAHVVLGHTGPGTLDDHDGTPVSLREVEAECVSLICCESLGLAGGEFCRGYIQHWLGSGEIPERSAHRVFKAAAVVLKAGYAAKPRVDAV